MTLAAILKHKGHDVSVVAPGASIAEVVTVLSNRHIGAVLVRDGADAPLGILSERDIVASLAANGARTLEMTAGQLMTRAVKTALLRTSVGEAMSIMTTGRFRHLPVMDRGELVGLVSIGDVVKAKIMEQEHEVTELRAYVAGAA